MSKEKQIEEMAKILCGVYNENCRKDCCRSHDCYIEEDCRTLYNTGYRKQSEGENVATYPSSSFECSECHWEDWDLLTADSAYNFCPNCGAKMKGGGE